MGDKAIAIILSNYPDNYVESLKKTQKSTALYRSKTDPDIYKVKHVSLVIRLVRDK
jgi:hypothetical protein